MSSDTWYYVQNGATIGPMPRSAMDALIQSGVVRPDTLVTPGYGDWVMAASTELAPVFNGGGKAKSRSLFERKDYLPKDPGKRKLAQAAIVIVGLYAIYSGIGQMSLGLKELAGDNSVQFMGCTGVSADAVQCGFQNMAQQNRMMCMDVVILCNDGRHVASTCSDKILPGASSMKVVNNFSPAVTTNLTCQSISYENVKTKG